MALLAVIAAISASAHDLEFTYIIVVLKTDGTFQADVTCDLDALVLGVGQGADSKQVVRRLRRLPEAELARRVERVRQDLVEQVTVSFDGVAMRDAPGFPEYGPEYGPEYVQTDNAPIPTILGLTARFMGTVPPSAKTITVRVDRRFPPVYLTILTEAQDAKGARDAVEHQVLARGAVSDAIFLSPGFREPQGKLTVAWRYLRLGFWHIIPEGLDHILFVVGLFLLSAKLKPLLLQVTAFTVAHTVSLALSTYGAVRLSPSIVEPLIALSIAYVATENLFTRELTPWRPGVVFLFGLLHGLGFAGVLGELGIPEPDVLVALLSFNVGVEAGQLAVLVLAFVTVGWFRNKLWYRARVTIPMSLIIAIIGLYWAWERL